MTSSENNSLKHGIGQIDGSTSRTQTDRIVEFVIGQIFHRQLTSGHRLPSVRTMAQLMKVSNKTVLRAYDRLIARGLIYAMRGSGFYVAKQASSSPPSPLVTDRGPFDCWRLIHCDHSIDRFPGTGLLRHAKDAQLEVNQVLRAAVATVDGDYGDPLGYLPLRHQLRDKLFNEGVDVSIENIVTAPGAVAGITLVVRSLLRAGSYALIEDPCSFVHPNILLSQGAEIISVPRLPDGPDLDVLRTLCERYRPFMFLLSSVLHNPTSTSISPYKAQKLIEIAEEFDLLMVDDCTYADLRPTLDVRVSMPLITLDRAERTVHIGSFSHTLTPSVGIGFVVANAERMRYLRYFRPTAGLGNMQIQQRLVYRFLNEGLYRRRNDRLLSRLARTAATLSQMFAESGLEVMPRDGDLFFWVRLGGDEIDPMVIAQRMLAKGYLTAPGNHFVHGDRKWPFMRFNVTTTNAGTIRALAASL